MRKRNLWWLQYRPDNLTVSETALSALSLRHAVDFS